MAEPVPISLGTRSNPARHIQGGNARLINCFAEEAGQEAKSPWLIYPRAGLRTWTAELSEESGIRAFLPLSSVLYVVMGQNVYSVGTDGTATYVGGLASASGPVFMAANRASPTQVGLVDVATGEYHVIEAGVMTKVDDEDLPPPCGLAYLDGFFIFPISDGRVFSSELDDATTINALDFSSVESSPDALVGAARLEREMVFFGTDSIEWWANTGEENFPLTRQQTADVGCLGAQTIQNVETPGGRTLIWVAPDHTVRMMTGYSAQVISSNEISELLRAVAEQGDADDLDATAWAAGGQYFYALSRTTAGKEWTRIYDSRTGGWQDARSHQMKRWRVSKTVRFDNRIIAGDAQTGRLYEMRSDVYSEGEHPMVMEVITPPVHAFPYPIRIHGLYLDVASGVGKATTEQPDSDPEVIIDWSHDGGQTWSTPRYRSLGKMGKTQQRVKVFRLGRATSKGVSFRFRIAADVQRMMASASVNFDRLAVSSG